LRNFRAKERERDGVKINKARGGEKEYTHTENKEVERMAEKQSGQNKMRERRGRGRRRDDVKRATATSNVNKYYKICM